LHTTVPFDAGVVTVTLAAFNGALVELSLPITFVVTAVSYGVVPVSGSASTVFAPTVTFTVVELHTTVGTD